MLSCEITLTEVILTYQAGTYENYEHFPYSKLHQLKLSHMITYYYFILFCITPYYNAYYIIIIFLSFDITLFCFV